jgi:5-methylcytosine-specific restriction endonuclease McrA
MSECIRCKQSLAKWAYVYCSNQCQRDFDYEQYIIRWKNGAEDGGRGVAAKNISGHVRKYILLKYKYSCSNCGWDEKNPVTNKSPLDVDHIDGDSENNTESNLRLLCPNCHSLTPSYKNLNSGKGRQWRKLKYMKNS